MTTPRPVPPVLPTTAEVERFFAKVEKGEGCWNWTAANCKGYGRFGWRGQLWQAHRLSYSWSKGSIPAGLVIDHLCRNPSCVNPDHLEPVVERVNILRGVGPSAKHAVKTACPQGHPYDAKNTYHYRGMRMCRACRAAQGSRRSSGATAQRMKADPTHPAHGTLTGYTAHGCRCQTCRDRWAAYSRERRASRLMRAP